MSSKKIVGKRYAKNSDFSVCLSAKLFTNQSNTSVMKKTWIIVVAILALVVIFCVTSYNSLVSKEEAVETAWSNVENQYQRRADLIPNLVNNVQGYADHNQAKIDAVVSARAKAKQT